jgi:hypothetical protein
MGTVVLEECVTVTDVHREIAFLFMKPWVRVL